MTDIGLTHGWLAPDDRLPSCEDVAANIDRIDDLARFDVPLSGLDEMDTVVAEKRRHDA